MKQKYELLREFLRLNIFKTLYFNLRYFPLKTALHLPVHIFRNVEISMTKGKIVLPSPKYGMVKLGKPDKYSFDRKGNITKWKSEGTLIVHGQVIFGRGCGIRIGKEATLEIGQNTCLTGHTDIACFKQITIGRDCLISWDVLIMDTDFHHIKDNNGKLNEPKPIVIGDHVWIGCRCTVLKGTTIQSDNVIAAGTLVTRNIKDTKSVIGSVGGKLAQIKEEVSWSI